MEERKLRKRKEKAINESNYEQIYTYCKELGDEHTKVEEYEEALAEYKEAERAAKKLQNKLFVAIANRMIGETLCNMGEFEKAIAHQKVYYNFSKEENDLVEEQRALATLGRTYFVEAESFSNEDQDKKKCLQLSRKYYLKSLNICDRLSQSNKLSQRELSEMKARLYLNLGLILESEGDIDSGFEHVAKAINICKHLELLEILCRCYTAQGSLYLKHGDTSNAILNYDAALKVSDRLESRIIFSCEILLLKADVLIELSDFTGAKNVLIKAYKLKTPDMKLRNEIEKKLKFLVKICRTENKLLEISEDDYNSKKCLNETLGDCFAKLECYKKAIEYYRKMLECSEALCLTGKDITPAYYSLSQTYKDDGQYDMALKYFERLFEIEKDNPVEASKTLLNIIEVLELRKEDFDVIMEKYRQALSLAKKAGDFKTEAIVLGNMILSERAYGREDLASETQKELDVVKCCFSNEDSEIISNASGDESEFDVDLEELSDVNTDTEDDVTGREKHSRRRVTKSFLIRRNEKGETPLHVASAKGNLQLVRSLLKQGHPVNVPDAAGWSPLHEACNHGQVEVAKILIDAGANIDDRGGPNCDGITPLHDAASCGHLEVIDMLLDNGATPLARNNQGETALDCLIACKRRVESEEGELDPVKLEHFNNVRSRLEECLSKVGYNSKKNTPKQCVIDSRSQRTEDSRISQKFVNNRSFVANKKRSNPGSFDDTFNSGADEYKETMQALRHGNKKECPSLLSERHEKSKAPALLSNEDVGDDWLENDLELSKRPIKRRCEQSVEHQQIKTTKSKSAKPNTSYSTQKKNLSTPVKSNWDEAFDDIDLDDLDFAVSPQISSTNFNTNTLEEAATSESTHNDGSSAGSGVSNPNRSNKMKPKYQKSLLSVGFKRFDPSSHSTQQSVTNANISGNVEFRESPATPRTPATNQSIKVRVEGKLFLVPVPIDYSDLNIKWLVSEAARRYQNLEGVLPLLSLSTEDGAILDENDPISIVVGKNEIQATALSWDLAPLVDRYREACASSNTTVDEYLSIQLDICQANACFQIKDVPVALQCLTPALKAISYHQNLQRISLCGVFLRNTGFKVLVDSITKLTQLRCLDVRSNNITAEGLSYFVMVLSKNASLQNLEELDLSYNPLGGDCVHQLANLTRHLVRLRVLILKSIGLISQSLYEASNFNLEFVEYLDVSNNPLEREGSAKFLSALDSNKIKFLDMSRTGGTEVFRECLLFLDRGYLDMLETLKLADLDINDNDVQQLIQSLKKADQISNLDLSCNTKISDCSHTVISELKNLKELNLAGCSLLTASNQLILPFCGLTLSSEYHENTFREAPYNLIVN